MDRFRLVSIYIGNFGCFHNQIFDFCSDYKMVREPDCDGKLCLKVMHKKVLPDNFFSMPDMGKSCVDSVSAIIGKNGTGKSTLARLLCNLPHDDAKEKDVNERWNVVVVYEFRGELCGYKTKGCSCVSAKDDNGAEVHLDNRSLLVGRPLNDDPRPISDKPYYRFFYYSPYYTTEQSDWDFSENGDDVTNISTTWLVDHPEHHSEMDGYGPAIYKRDELLRVFDFLAAYKKHFALARDEFEIPEPISANVELTRDIPEDVSSDSLWKKLIGEIGVPLRYGKTYSFSLSDEQMRKRLDKLIRDYFVWLYSRAQSHLLRITPVPNMSSGQMSFVSLFARLYRFVRKGDDNRPVVVFLDEAETALHPEWQRRLVSYLIRFLNVFMPERRYQLIFASHSPTLLSDIPKGNCVFLQESKENNQYGLPLNKSVSFGDKEGGGKEGECDNTFGANIYDLYHNAFFLEHGAIGEFAEAKIHEALQKVGEVTLSGEKDGNNSKLDENIDMLMNLVGDRIVHRYFQRLKEFGLIAERA